jgi:hypothetical protein
MDILDLGERIPTREQAEAYLVEAARLNPGPLGAALALCGLGR